MNIQGSVRSQNISQARVKRGAIVATLYDIDLIVTVVVGERKRWVGSGQDAAATRPMSTQG
jgi:hypothetical protein